MHDEGVGGYTGQLHLRPARDTGQDQAAGGARQAGRQHPPQPHRPPRGPVFTVFVPVDEQPAAERVAADGHHPAVGHLPLRDGGLQQVSPLRLRRVPHSLEARSSSKEGFPGDPTLHPECSNGEVERQGHQLVGRRGLPPQVHLRRRAKPPPRLQNKNDVVILACDTVFGLEPSQTRFTVFGLEPS